MKELNKLRNIIIEFLDKNGFYKSNNYIKIHNDEIRFYHDSFSNSSYTKAIGLFYLLFTEDNLAAYLVLDKEYDTIILRFRQSIAKLTTYIEKRSELEVIYF